MSSEPVTSEKKRLNVRKKVANLLVLDTICWQASLYEHLWEMFTER